MTDYARPAADHSQPTGAAWPQPGAPTWSQPNHSAASKGFLAALFDFGFTSFVTPKVIKVLYVLVVVVAAISALGFALTAFSLGPVFGLVALVIGAPLIFLITIAFYRIILEFFSVIFQLGADMRAVRNQGQQR